MSVQPGSAHRSRRNALILLSWLSASTALPIGCDEGVGPGVLDERFMHVTASVTTPLDFSFSCGLTVEGDLFCWGAYPGLNEATADVCAIGGTQPPFEFPCSLRPDRIESAVTLVTVDAGGRHVCGLDAAGRAYCWGENESGQLGDGSTMDRATPVAVTGGHVFAMIDAGLDHTCGVTTAGDGYCWGENQFGRLGDGSEVDRASPTPIAGGLQFLRLAAGWSHSCGVTGAGDAYCWGRNGVGALGADSSSLTPIPVSGGLSFADASAGTEHSCGLGLDDETYCWGSNDGGALGIPLTVLASSTPQPVQGDIPFTGVSVGWLFTCGLSSSGEAFCWGRESGGQIGNGADPPDCTSSPMINVSCHPAPVAVAGGLDFSRISAGTSHACGVTTDGRAYCWGGNEAGELGDGTTRTRHTPSRVF